MQIASYISLEGSIRVSGLAWRFVQQRSKISIDRLRPKEAQSYVETIDLRYVLTGAPQGRHYIPQLRYAGG